MSLSRRNDSPIEDSAEETLPCPQCGQFSMIRVKGDCVLLDGVVVPNLERWHCTSCGEDYFDTPAMDTISAFRRKVTSKDRKKQRV